MILNKTGVCISLPTALCLAPWLWPRSPALAPNLCLLALVPNLYLPALAPNLYLPVLVPNWYLPTRAPKLYLPALAPNLYLPALAVGLYLLALAPKLYLPALAYGFITSPGREFTYTNLVSSVCICIYGPCIRFELPVRGLNLHLLYSSSNGSNNRSNTNSTIVFMPILVN